MKTLGRLSILGILVALMVVPSVAERPDATPAPEQGAEGCPFMQSDEAKPLCPGLSGSGQVEACPFRGGSEAETRCPAGGGSSVQAVGTYRT